MARVRRGETNALLADARVHMFALTSGTTATRKYIPVTDQYLADYKRGWNLWGLKVFRDHPEVAMRPIVQMSGDWQETHTESGVPCGAVTGLTAHMQKRIVRWLYCVPAPVSRIKDALAKYYVALRLSLPRRVGMMIAANPSTLINMAKLGDQEKESLLRDLADGTLNRKLRRTAGHTRRAAARGFDPAPNGCANWKAIIARTGNLYPRDYWGPDCLLGNWTGGSMGAYLRHYPRYFGDCPGARRGPDRQRRPHDHPAVGRHAGRRPRRDFALLRVHPRSGDGKSTTDGVGRPRTARGPQLLHPADDGVRPVPL